MHTQKYYRKPWTKDKVKLMEQFWPHFGTYGMEKLLNLDRKQIKCKATRMGLHILPLQERLCIDCRKEYQQERLRCHKCHLAKRKLRRENSRMSLEQWIGLMVNTVRYRSKSPKLETIDDMIDYFKNMSNFKGPDKKAKPLLSWTKLLLSIAKKRAIPSSDLTTEYMVELWNNQKGKCYYSGIEMVPHVNGTGRSPYSPSIDRVVPSKGYVKGNVVWTCWACNAGKSIFSVEEYVSTCQAVVDNFKNRSAQ